MRAAGSGPGALLRSTPVRLALGLVALFAAVNLLSLGVAYVKLRADAYESLRASLAQSVGGLDITATPGALATLVGARARVADPSRTVYVFIGDDGRAVGNAAARIEPGQITLSAIPDGRPLGEAGYLQEVRQLSGGVLIVAESLAPVRDLGRTFLTVLILSLIPTVLISLGAGAWIARRAARRVDEIDAVLERATNGDLTARVPTDDAADDDLSRIGVALNRMVTTQEAATEALRQVTADIAHDLRTPLQRISVHLDDLVTRLADRPEDAALAETALDETQRAVSVFRGLLQIAQLEGGSPRAGFAPVDLPALAQGIAELYQPSAEERGDRLDLELPGHAVLVPGDRDLLGQALANLVENALRHTPDGSRIRVAVTEEDGRPVLSVTDDGPGIPEEERGNAVKRLYRLERSRTTPGHGLGLALVTAIAGLHGADVILTDAGPGLRVALRFPAVERD